MTEAAIHRMISQRLMAKMNRDFEVADRVQTELAEEGSLLMTGQRSGG